MVKNVVPPKFQFVKGPPPTRRQLLLSKCLYILGFVTLSSYTWLPISQFALAIAQDLNQSFPTKSTETYRAILLIAPAVVGTLTFLFGLSLRSNDRVTNPHKSGGPIIH